MTERNDWFVTGGTVLTMNDADDAFEDGVVHIQGDRIVALGGRGDVPVPEGADTLDAKGCLVLPGLVNGHTHLGMGLLKGVAEDLPLEKWLNDKIFPLERKWGSAEFVYTGALLSCLEMIRSGTTLFNDMYYFEEEAARAAHEAGLRGVLGQTFVEISGVGDPEAWKPVTETFLDAVSRYPLVVPGVAPHSVYGVSRAFWESLLAYAREKDLIVHFHLSETATEVRECLAAHGMTPPRFCEELGVWSQKSIAAHATCLTIEDIDLLGEREAHLVHNPESNLKLGTQISPVAALRSAGAVVALGTDSVASNNDLDLLQEASTAAKLQTYRKGIGSLKVRDVARMLTIEGARALYLDGITGSLEPGKRADFICLDVTRPHAVPLYEPYVHLAYSARGADVRHSVVNGKVLLRDGVVQSVDEKAILAEAAKWRDRIRREL